MKIRETYQTAKILTALALATFMGCGSDYEPMPTVQAERKTSEPSFWETEMVEEWTMGGKYRMRKGVPSAINRIVETELRQQGLDNPTSVQWTDTSMKVADAMDENKDNRISVREAYDYSSDYFDQINAQESQNE